MQKGKFRTHNPKVVGSNPASAKFKKALEINVSGAFSVHRKQREMNIRGKLGGTLSFTIINNQHKYPMIPHSLMTCFFVRRFFSPIYLPLFGQICVAYGYTNLMWWLGLHVQLWMLLSEHLLHQQLKDLRLYAEVREKLYEVDYSA